MLHNYLSTFCLVTKDQKGNDVVRVVGDEPITYSAASDKDAVHMATALAEGIARDYQTKHGEKADVRIEIIGSNGLVRLTDEQTTFSLR